jgi:hypothetical protein
MLSRRNFVVSADLLVRSYYYNSGTYEALVCRICAYDRRYDRRYIKIEKWM